MLTVRKVTPDDRGLLDEAAKADPFHVAAGLTGEHWSEGNTLIYADLEGVVLAVRTSNVARLDGQFIEPGARSRNVLLAAFWPLMDALRKKGIEEVIFNSNSVAVVNFFKRRFHFRHLGGNTYSLRIK